MKINLFFLRGRKTNSSPGCLMPHACWTMTDRQTVLPIPRQYWTTVAGMLFSSMNCKQMHSIFNWIVCQEQHEGKERSQPMAGWFQLCNLMEPTAYLVSYYCRQRWHRGKASRTNSFLAQRPSLEDKDQPLVTWCHSPGGKVSYGENWWGVQNVH